MATIIEKIERNFEAISPRQKINEIMYLAKP